MLIYSIPNALYIHSVDNFSFVDKRDIIGVPKGGRIHLEEPAIHNQENASRGYVHLNILDDLLDDK